MYEKLNNKMFVNDLSPLLNVNSDGAALDLINASKKIYGSLIKQLPGEPWKKLGALSKLFETI